jgi:putative membrane protein
MALALAVAAVAYGLAYSAAYRARRTVPRPWRAYAYLAGVLTLALALLGPLDDWSGVLFSAHMVQHLLLTVVGPPLLALGRPVQVLLRGLPSAPRRALLRQTLGRPPVRGLLAKLVHPIVLALAVNGSVLIWHLPALYSAALRQPFIHELEHACFFGSALLFWWALVGPELPRAHRLSTSAALLLLFTTWMASDLLGATLTLASTLLYPDYAATPKPWGLTALADQRLGGLIMWVGGGVFYATVMVGRLVAPYLSPRRGPLAVRSSSRASRPSAEGRDRRTCGVAATDQRV